MDPGVNLHSRLREGSGKGWATRVGTGVRVKRECSTRTNPKWCGYPNLSRAFCRPNDSRSQPLCIRTSWVPLTGGWARPRRTPGTTGWSGGTGRVWEFFRPCLGRVSNPLVVNLPSVPSSCLTGPCPKENSLSPIRPSPSLTPTPGDPQPSLVSGPEVTV